ncbi:MAG: undecaprenyl diphosphate synthase [Hyphomonadaceae bacterium]|nr:MAG: undecaprenyl diphosphate synthase [Hyphomonadaceae bacterium]
MKSTRSVLVDDNQALRGSGDDEGLHFAIIMDGNGRWAAARKMPRAFGHKAGVDALRGVVEAAPKMGIKTLSIYAFSTENWRRPSEEVDSLFNLLRQFVKSDLARLHKNNVKIRIQGQRQGLATDILKLIDDAEVLTKNNNALTLVICLNYGGQSEIVEATKAIAEDVQSGKLAINQIDMACFEDYLLSKDWPNPDLIIRTAGEKRLSNFLLWQSAYSEFAFTEVLWPDFDANCLQTMVSEYSKRQRRFGSV